MAKSEMNETSCLWALAKSWDIDAEKSKSAELTKTFRAVAKQLRFRINMIEERNDAKSKLLAIISGHLTSFAIDGWIERFCVTPTHVTLWGSDQTNDRAATLIAALPQSTLRPSEEIKIFLTLLEWLRECKPNASPSTHPIKTLLEDIQCQDHEDRDSDTECSFADYLTPKNGK